MTLTLTNPLVTSGWRGCCGDGSKMARTRLARCCRPRWRLAGAHTVSKAMARHALGVLVKTGHERHVEPKLIRSSGGSPTMWEAPVTLHEPGDATDLGDGQLLT